MEFLDNHNFTKTIGASLLAASALSGCVARPEAAPVVLPPDLCGKVQIDSSPEGSMLSLQAVKKGEEMFSASTGNYSPADRERIGHAIMHDIGMQQHGLTEPDLPHDSNIHPGNVFEVCIDPKNPENVLVSKLADNTTHI